MAKFQFRLENILVIKAKLEEQEKINFGIAMNRLREAQAKLMKLSERKDHSQMVLKGILSDGATVIKIRQAEEALEIVKMYYKMQQLEVTLEEKNLEMARKRLEEAMVERKTYEKLKEKEFEKFKLQVLEEENKEIDELVSYKFSPVYTKK